jgi:hypothetical protein
MFAAFARWSVRFGSGNVRNDVREDAVLGIVEVPGRTDYPSEDLLDLTNEMSPNAFSLNLSRFCLK